MRTTLRPAHPEDFDYCARLYFEGMEKIIKELSLLWADAVEKELRGITLERNNRIIRVYFLNRTCTFPPSF